MEKLIIKYPNGQMTFNVYAFFPCKIDVARKVFPFINKWISEDDFNALWDELSMMYEYFRCQSENAKEMRDRAEVNYRFTDKRHYNSKFTKYETLTKRCKKNIEILIGGCRL